MNKRWEINNFVPALVDITNTEGRLLCRLDPFLNLCEAACAADLVMYEQNINTVTISIYSPMRKYRPKTYIKHQGEIMQEL